MMLESGRVLAGRYMLLRRLGAGRTSEAWLARDESTGRDVALRFPAAGQSSDRMPAEAVVAAACSHPALLPAGRIEQADGLDFVVTEFMPGGDIGRLRGRPWSMVLRRVLPIVGALDALHAAGLVHGDVKSSNVLLDGDGLPRLADMGSVRRIGEKGDPAGSPYSMSPQQQDGEPASTADDVYAVGVLLYELIGGHPPFYPDISAGRVRSEVAAPLATPDVPQQLREIVARCLDKDPAQRPAGMAELDRELRQCLESYGDTAPAAAAGWVPRPPADPAPIRPLPRRFEGTEPSARQLRSEGFRRGIVVSAFVIAAAATVFVFFVLPGIVGQEAPATRPAAATHDAPAEQVPALPAPADLERLAGLKGDAEKLRSALVPRMDAIKARDVMSWGAAGFAALQAKLAASDRSAAARDYAAALADLQGLDRDLASIEKRRLEVLRETEKQGQDALAAGRSLEARQKFEAALRIEPSSTGASLGLKRASVLDDVMRQLAAGARFEQDGNLKAAGDAYRRALALDPANAGARDGLARTESRLGGEAYSAAMARGLGALSRKDYVAARAAFEQAGKMRPGAPEVADGLRQVEQALHTRDLSAIIERATRAEHEERWSDALTAYKEALKSDATLLGAQQGVERVEPRAMLDAELQVYLERPDRLFTPEGRGVASSVLQRARQVPQPGPRLTGQIAKLGALVEQAATPVRVSLASDTLTEVQIYRVGRLGAFDRREVELLPGKYTAVGTRPGFRDVRREFTVMPGSPPPALVIRCEEQI